MDYMVMEERYEWNMSVESVGESERQGPRG